MAVQEKLRVKGTEEFRVPTENDVVVGNQIVGTDPDPQVRAQIKRDAGEGTDGNN